MKKTLAFLLLMTLTLCAAHAEPAPAYRMPIEENTPFSIDLNDDDTPETVSWQMVAENEYEDRLVLTVTPENGEPISYKTDICCATSVYVTDLNSDNIYEILLSGDVMSDDYCTYCVQFTDGALHELTFADAARGENTGEYRTCGYGSVADIYENGQLTLSGSQDTVGTWFGSRVFTLTDENVFEFADDGMWVRDIDTSDESVWEYMALSLKAELTVTTDDGSEKQLVPGDKLLLIASDKVSCMRVLLQDGSCCTLSIAQDTENWGWYVNGIHENDLFEYVPYAD